MTPSDKGVSLGALLKSKQQEEEIHPQDTEPRGKESQVAASPSTPVATASARAGASRSAPATKRASTVELDEPWKQNTRIVKVTLNARVNDEIRTEFKRLIRTTEDEFHKRVTVDASVEALVSVLLEGETDGELRRAWKHALWNLLD